MLKRLTALILSLVMVITFAACSGGKTESEPEEAKLPTDIDLEGYEFVIAEGYYYDAGDMPVMEYGESDYIDAILDRNALIEDTYNCTITYEYYTPTTLYNILYPSILAGEKVADIITPTLYSFGQFLNSNSLYDLSKLPYVNLDNSYYSSVYSDVATAGDAIYGTSANFAHPYKRVFSCFFNKKLVAEAGLQDPYKLVESGDWTWSKFEEYCKAAIKDANTDGVYDDNDIFGACGANMDALIAFYMSSGNNIFEVSENRVKYNLDNSDSIDLINRMNKIFTVPGFFYNPNMDFTKIQNHFQKGNVMFFINGAAVGSGLRDMSDDFGILPMPKADKDSDYYCGIDHNAPIVYVPSSIDNPDATGLILEALSYESADELKVWLEESSAGFFRDDKSVEMLEDYIIPSLTIDAALLYHTTTEELGIAVDSVIGNTILRDPNSDPASLIGAYKELAQTQIDEICNN